RRFYSIIGRRYKLPACTRSKVQAGSLYYVCPAWLLFLRLDLEALRPENFAAKERGLVAARGDGTVFAQRRARLVQPPTQPLQTLGGELLQRPHVHDVDAAAVRGNDQLALARMNDEIMHGDCGQMRLAVPDGAAVERQEQTELRARIK